MTRRYWPLWIMLSATLLVVGAARAAQPFRFTSFDFPGAMLTNAQGINPEGDIVGFYLDTAGSQHGFLLRNGEFRELNFPDAEGTAARGINPGGQIVGSYSEKTGTAPANIHGWLLSQGTFSEVQFPGHLGTFAQRILPNGDILGCYHDNDLMLSMHGMMRTEEDDFSGLDVPASMSNGATPDRNKIAGFYTDMTDLTHGFLIEYGNFRKLDVPGSSFTQAWDINPYGEVVGTFHDSATSRVHGFQRSAGEGFVTIDFPGATVTQAFGINSRDEVVGAYVDAAGKTHGYLLSRTQDRDDDRDRDHDREHSESR